LKGFVAMKFDFDELKAIQSGQHHDFVATHLPNGVLHGPSGSLLTGASSSLLTRLGMLSTTMESLQSGATAMFGMSAGPNVLPALSFPTGTANPLVAPPVSGFHINLNFDAAALAAPQSFRDGITAAAQMIEAVLSDNITVNLAIHYKGTGGGAFAGPSGGFFEPYAQVRSALLGNASAGDHTFDALPDSAKIQGENSVVVWNAEAKVLGIIAANATDSDGSATFAKDIDPGLLIGVALHELTHAMGRVPYGPEPDIFDLFRLTGVGTYLFDGGLPAPQANYFSIDGGTTKLADYGITSDPSDFLNSGVQGPNDPFNEFYSGGTIQQLSLVDIMQMIALGFHFKSAAGPDLIAINETLTGASFSVRLDNIGTSSAGSSKTGVYLSTNNTINANDLLLASVSTAGIGAGGFLDKAVTLAFSGAQAPGTYYIGAIADRAAAVSEGSELNNSSGVVTVILGDNNANTVNGTAANDHIFALGGADTINPGKGNDTIDAGDGKDVIKFKSTVTFTAADRIDGGANSDTLNLTGNYSAGVTFNATTLVNVEKILLGAGFDYKLTTHNATVAAGATLAVDASALGSGNKLTFNGSAETDGHFSFISGLGSEDLRGGGLSDTFKYSSAADSTSTAYDTIRGFDFASDRFDLPGSAGTVTGIDAGVATGALDSGATFDTELLAAMTGHLGAHHAILFTPNAGSLTGQTFMVVDVNGNAAYDTGTDFVFHLVGQSGTLATSDFV
jgi:hypothetical protein